MGGKRRWKRKERDTASLLAPVRIVRRVRVEVRLVRAGKGKDR